MPYFTAAQIEIEMATLAAGSGGVCTRVQLPRQTSSEGMGATTYSYIKIGKGAGAGRPCVLAVAGMHAREWAQPDAVISFAKKLVAAYTAGGGFTVPAYTDTGGNTYGPLTVSAALVKRMIEELDVLILPLANPDGRAFSQSGPANRNWRKNRAPRPVGGSDATVGVDLNRNFDIAWDYELYFTNAFASSGILSASKDPAQITFIGKPKVGLPSKPGCEPEVLNIISILDNNPVTYCVDLHSYLMRIMHSWGIEQNGANPAQTFQNAAFDHQRDGTHGNFYSEYFPNDPPLRLRDRHRLIVGSMRDAVRTVTGRDYTVGGIADTIYPATGSLSDFAFSRQFVVAGSRPIHSFAIEFGDAADNFQPGYDDPHGFRKIEREVHAVMLRLLEEALAGPRSTVPGGGPGGGSSKCLFSIAVDGLAIGEAWLDALRRGRSALLAHRRSRGTMLATDRVYRRLSAWFVPRIAGRRWMKRAIAYGLVAPLAGLSELMLRRATQ